METDLYAVLDTNYLRELLNTGREREREVTNEEELNVFNLILLIPPFLRYGLISKLLLPEPVVWAQKVCIESIDFRLIIEVRFRKGYLPIWMDNRCPTWYTLLTTMKFTQTAYILLIYCVYITTLVLLFEQKEKSFYKKGNRIGFNCVLFDFYSSFFPNETSTPSIFHLINWYYIQRRKTVKRIAHRGSS